MLWSSAARRGLGCNADRKPFRPTTLEKVLRACAFARKAALELDQRLWKPALRPRHGSTLLISRVTSLHPVFSFCTQHLDGPDARAQAVIIDLDKSRSLRHLLH